MQITGAIDWNEEQSAAVVARELDQREEVAAVRCLAAKLSTDGRSPDYHSARDMYYLDMDEALPLHWESLTGKGQHKFTKSTDSSEFEFSMSGVAINPLDPAVSADGVSPADDLFYKGQLLPLLLPKRQQMVEKLSSPKLSDKVDSITVSCFFQPGSLKYAPDGDDANLGSALVNSRSSSFHSQGSNSFWDSDSPNELDSGDSSSSRDSSGSSNDSVNVPGKQSLPKFNDHIAFQKEEAIFQQQDYLECHNKNSSNNSRQSVKPQFPSWLRTPFKWRLFSALKKPLRSSAVEVGAEESSGSGGKISFSSGSNIGRPSGERRSNIKSARGSYYSAEMNIRSTKEPATSHVDVCHRGGILFPGEGSFRTDGEGPASSKSRESLHKYFNLLKVSAVKAATSAGMAASKISQSAKDSSSGIIVDGSARSSFSGSLTPTSSPQQHQSSFKPGFSKSTQNSPSFLDLKSSFHLEKPRSRTPSPFSLSGNLRVPSFSRSSRASANASIAATSGSPYHSGLLNHSPSTMAELHSAIQGAIAHCKQSQAVIR